MAYSDLVKKTAFEWYIAGLTYEAIARKLSKRFGLKINPKRIADWAKAQKAKGHGLGGKTPATKSWFEMKQEAVALRQTAAEKAGARTVESRLEEIEALLDRFADEFRTTEMGKVNPQRVYAYNQLLKTRNDLVPYKLAPSNVEEITQRLFRVLKAHPKIGPILKQYGDEAMAMLAKDLEKK